MADLDWSKCPVVESIPGKVSGAWVLKGTRMPVSAIFENLEAGASIGDILEWFDGVDRTQVEAVIEFVARSLDRTPECTAKAREYTGINEKTRLIHLGLEALIQREAALRLAALGGTVSTAKSGRRRRSSR